MTKYKLEEFREWLAADPERKAGLENWNYALAYWKEFAQDHEPVSTWTVFKLHWQVIQEWRRERERERANLTKRGGKK